MKKILFLLSFTILFTNAQALCAEEKAPAVNAAAEKIALPFGKSSQKKKPHVPTYGEKLDKKFDRGAENFLVGWTEILSAPSERCQKAKEKNAWNKFLAGTSGLGEGLVNGALDTTLGFFNMLTSPMPGWSLPLPDGGVDISQLTADKGRPAVPASPVI